LNERDLATVRNALEFYANPQNWQKDDWGVTAVLSGHKRGEGYGNPHVKAQRALQAFRRLYRA
jgi:hypothetical protein